MGVVEEAVVIEEDGTENHKIQRELYLVLPNTGGNEKAMTTSTDIHRSGIR